MDASLRFQTGLYLAQLKSGSPSRIIRKCQQIMAEPAHRISFSFSMLCIKYYPDMYDVLLYDKACGV
jgi:hypothetical protein